MFKIGNVEIKNKVVLAPMAGISNSAYRTIIKDMKAGLIVAEMVSDKAIMYESKKTLDMLYMTDYERPISQQIFGSDKSSFVIAAKYIEKNMNPDIIDINMGCPVPKLVRNGEGSALMRSPELCERIVYAVASAVDVPVTAKFRKTCDDENPFAAIEVAKACERGGASAVFVHGRTRTQMYSGLADRQIIKAVKETVSIPVIGNGDVCSYDDYMAMKNETGCDGVMIGRGAYGAPWVFDEIVSRLEGREYSAPDNKKKKEMLLMQFEAVLAEKGVRGIQEFRHHLLQYCKGFSGSARLRKEISTINKPEDVLIAIETVFVE